MNKIIDIISGIKQNFKRDNFIFLRRRVDRGDSKKTLGWILTKEDSSMCLENLDFNRLNNMKYRLRNNGK